VRLFDVEIQGPGNRVAAIGNGIKSRLRAVDRGAFYFFGILVEKAEAEYAER
jgi:hypothetical protein